MPGRKRLVFRPKLSHTEIVRLDDPLDEVHPDAVDDGIRFRTRGAAI